MKKRNPNLLLSDKFADNAGFYPPEPHPHSQTFKIFETTLMRLLFANFKWYGLEPYEANAIERLLINNGKVCAIKTSFDIDTETPDGIFYGYYGTDVNNITYDFYGRCNKASVSGLNGKVYVADDPSNFVVGFDSMYYYQLNTMATPIVTYVRYLAKELDEAYQTLKVAAETRKSGIVFQCSNKRSEQLLKQVLKNRSENSPYIIITSDIGNETETLFRPPNSQDLTEYYQYFINTWGIVLDILGFENSGNNKRERLVVSESERNRSLSRYVGADRLQARKNFAEELNKKFGTNIQVENYLASMITENGNDANIYGEQVKEDVPDRM